MAPRKKNNVSKTVSVSDNLPHNMGPVPETIKSEKPLKEEPVDSPPPESSVAEELVTPAKATPEAKKKAHKYKLNYEQSPFPDHHPPTPKAAEEVYRLLSKEHGQRKAPTKVPPPSATQSGCGEVPDLLDALLRTVLSANTSGTNSAAALQGLIQRFGAVDGSPNWHAVSQVKPEEITKAIHKGGLSVVKGKTIKNILNIIRAQNIERRDAFLKEKATGEPADVLATSHLTQIQKDAEIARIKDNPLTMAWVFEIKKDSDIIDELLKLPGIGVKTASCSLLFNMQRPSFAVDTHVHRHCKWLGWVPPNATADQTFNHCDLRLPSHLKYGLHSLFIKHGKICYKCRANTNPGSADWKKAKDCPIEHLVDRELTRKPRKKRKNLDSDESEGDSEGTSVKRKKTSGSIDFKPMKKTSKTTKSESVKVTLPKTKAVDATPSRPLRARAVKARAKSLQVKDDSESEDEEVVSEYDE
ncbi:putative DNA glycosylase [Lachnellula occidentalis]|uniref:Putative DNA glycosylase n=1 Tax=Lachnellula occidentalis TaxID=215460 RepID=A0A8H8UG91_9HELO|nr:putative DNA glycosylase [Lachnellula occidentalis]